MAKMTILFFCIYLISFLVNDCISLFFTNVPEELEQLVSKVSGFPFGSLKINSFGAITHHLRHVDEKKKSEEKGEDLLPFFQ